MRFVIKYGLFDIILMGYFYDVQFSYSNILIMRKCALRNLLINYTSKVIVNWRDI